jgi:hypothetical protein
MLPASTAFKQAVRGTHVMYIEIEAYVKNTTYPNGAWIPFEISDGSVEMDLDNPVSRNLKFTLSPRYVRTDGRRIDPVDLHVYGRYVRVRRGVMLADGHKESVPLGIFVVDTVDRNSTTEGEETTISCSDLFSLVKRARLLAPATYTNITRIALIKKLVKEAFTSGTVPFLPNGPAFNDTWLSEIKHDTAMKKTTVERERDATIDELLKALGCVGYFDAYGAYTIRPNPQASTHPPVYYASYGTNGVTLELGQSVTREGVYNGMVVIAENTDPDAPPVWHAAVDNNKNSPTYWNGPFGKNPAFLTSSYVHNKAQAKQAAEKFLPKVKILHKQIDLTILPDPTLEIGDQIQVDFPETKTQEKHIITSLTIPLVPTTAMDGTCALLEISRQNVE